METLLMVNIIATLLMAGGLVWTAVYVAGIRDQVGESVREMERKTDLASLYTEIRLEKVENPIHSINHPPAPDTTTLDIIAAMQDYASAILYPPTQPHGVNEAPAPAIRADSPDFDPNDPNELAALAALDPAGEVLAMIRADQEAAERALHLVPVFDDTGDQIEGESGGWLTGIEIDDFGEPS